MGCWGREEVPGSLWVEEVGQLGLKSKSLTACLFCFPIPFCLPHPISLPFFHLSSIFLSVSCTLSLLLCLLQVGPAFTFSHLLPLPHPLPPPWRGTDPFSVRSNPGPSPTSLLPPFPCPLLPPGARGASLPLPPLLSLSEGGGPGEGGGVPQSACGSWRCVWWGWRGLNAGEGVLVAALAARA